MRLRAFCLFLLITAASGSTGDRIRPADMEPLIPAGYEATDDDERGLWQVSDKLEKEIASSNLLVKDAALTQFVYGILQRLLGDAANDIRLYIVQNADFNASMFPNGMMLVHTGLLARMRNEAQLAAVLGHEAGHYFRQHTLSRWRDIKTKTAIMNVIALGSATASGTTGNNWYGVANAINATLLLAIFSYNRHQEQEADAYGLRLLDEAGYTPHAAANIWQQLIEERKASAVERNKRYRDRALSALSTHPPTAERMTDLQLSADELAGVNQEDTSPQPWPASVGELRWSFLNEQVKLNDPGASLYLVNALAQDGWNSELYFNLGQIYALRGKSGDNELAADAYANAVNFDDVTPLAFRAHGYAQLKQGNVENGRAALQRYLELRPDAADAAMVRFSIGQ